jgi:hypothetical protein
MGWHKGLGKMMGVYDEVRRALGRRYGSIVTRTVIESGVNLRPITFIAWIFTTM